ncbi:MAG: pentapeptide repeat-containing protein [Clostridia bacterium]
MHAFIDCNFNACDLRHTSFVRCRFVDTSAGDCDFRMANFSSPIMQVVYRI